MTHNIAVIAGDGIGKEVIPAGIAALERATKGSAASLRFTDLPWGCDYYLQQGRMMDADGFERLSKFDAIYLGAIGDPKVPDHIAVWDLLLPLRQRFQQYVNLRPMRLLPGLTSPLANRGPAEIDMVCVRENSEGEYAGPRRADSRRDAVRGRRTDRLVHADRDRAHPALRVRDRVETAAPAPGERDQVQRAAPLDGVLGRGGGSGPEGLPGRRLPEVSRRRDRRAHGDPPGVARRDRLLESLRRHPHRHRLGDLRQPGHRPGREHQPRADGAVDVRADSRLGAGHRRQRDREPDRLHLGRGDDARPSRPPRPARQDPRGDRARGGVGEEPDAGSRRAARRRRTWRTRSCSEI